MWVFRTHNIGTPYNECYRRVRNRYISEVEQGILPTRSSMEAWISRKMNERTNEATFSIRVPEELAEACLIESSMESYYNELSRGEKRNVVGTRTRKRIRCVICMNCKFTKIKLRCGHIFHRKCIDEWGRWKQTCPICQDKLEFVDDDGVAEEVHL